MSLPGGTFELKSTGDNFVPLLATRCLYWGVHLTKGQPDPKGDQMPSWSYVAPLLATKCLYQGVHLTKGQPNPKPGQMSSWPYVVLLLATRCLYWGASDLSAKRTHENLNILCVLGFASQRSFLRKTNNDADWLVKAQHCDLYCFKGKLTRNCVSFVLSMFYKYCPEITQYLKEDTRKTR